MISGENKAENKSKTFFGDCKLEAYCAHNLSSAIVLVGG